MGKITALYEIQIPSIPTNEEELPRQRPIVLKKATSRISIYPPGNKCTYYKKRLVGKNLQIEGTISQKGRVDADSICVFVQKDFINGLSQDEAEKSFSKLDIDVQYHILRLLRLMRRHIPKISINLPTELAYKALFRCDEETLKNILWSGKHGDEIKITSLQSYLDQNKWTKLRKEIKNEVDTELWEDFIYDAKAALAEHDFTKAVIYAAIACEVFIKNYIEEAAKKGGINKEALERLKSRRPRVLEYYDSILHLVTNHSLNIEHEELYKSIQQLFTTRNKIMHEGKTSVTQEKCETIEDMIKKAESTIAWVSSIKARSTRLV